MKGKKKNIGLSTLALLGYLGMVTVNALANILPINGVNTGELSDSYPNLFVPAGLTFSIWGLIYLLLGMFVVYRLIGSLSGRKGEGSGGEIDVLFFVSSLFNIGWIFCWHHRLVGVSLILMLLLLGTLIAIYLRLGTGRGETSKAKKIFFQIPFSVYLGWISIATIANATALLVHLDWNGFGISEQVWTIILLLVGLILTLFMLFTRRDPYYSLVVEWAYLGILLKRTGGEVILYKGLVAVVSVCMFVIAACLVIQAVRKKLY